MADRLFWTAARSTDPFYNLAMEEYMTLHCPEGTVILFLWQNKKTVVIGRNQDAYRECRAELLAAEGGTLARRASGGGAVFHDLGNLNFTFIARAADYNVDRQLDVILCALDRLGIDARKSGRNDLTADGRKFSGSAFFKSGDFCYHHGTLMLDVDKDMVDRYLTVSREKLSSKGVASVRSRVVNLAEFVPGLSIEQLAKSLLEAFSETYALPASELSKDVLPADALAQLRERYASWDWRFGRHIPSGWEITRRFEWGELTIRLKTDHGVITDVDVFSDAMDYAFAARLKSALAGCRCEGAALFAAVSSVPEITDNMRSDISEMLTESGGGGNDTRI